MDNGVGRGSLFLDKLAEESLANSGTGWPKPHPLAVKVALEPYPLDALPLPIRAAVEEVAGFVKAPVPMVASSAFRIS